MTETLREFIEELEEAEEVLKTSLIPFLRTMFHKFYEYRLMFSAAVNCFGELDCLCALSVVSQDQSGGPMCRPEVLASDET